mgnify:CR=1 FL=1
MRTSLFLRSLPLALLVLAGCSSHRVAYVTSNVAPTARPAPRPVPTAAPPPSATVPPTNRPPAAPPTSALARALETPVAKRQIVVIDLRKTFVCRSAGDGDCSLFVATAAGAEAPNSVQGAGKVTDYATFTVLGEEGDAYVVSPAARLVGCHGPLPSAGGMDVLLRVKKSAAVKVSENGCMVAGGTPLLTKVSAGRGPFVDPGTRLFSGTGEALGSATEALYFDGELDGLFGQRCFQKVNFAPVTDPRHRAMFCVPADAVHEAPKGT